MDTTSSRASDAAHEPPQSGPQSQHDKGSDPPRRHQAKRPRRRCLRPPPKQPRCQQHCRPWPEKQCRQSSSLHAVPEQVRPRGKPLATQTVRGTLAQALLLLLLVPRGAASDQRAVPLQGAGRGTPRPLMACTSRKKARRWPRKVQALAQVLMLLSLPFQCFHHTRALVETLDTVEVTQPLSEDRDGIHAQFETTGVPVGVPTKEESAGGVVPPCHRLQCLHRVGQQTEATSWSPNGGKPPRSTLVAVCEPTPPAAAQPKSPQTLDAPPSHKPRSTT